MSVVNLGEVLYIVQERRGRRDAVKTLTYIGRLPIEMLTARRQVAIRAAEIKAGKRLGYADSYAVASALLEQATVVTSDPDFQRMKDLVRIRWIRR